MGVLVLGSLLPSVASAQTADEPPTEVKRQAYAGVGVVDATWHVGASAGQYASKIYEGGDEPQHNIDPYGHSTPKNAPSYGIQSRNSARALLIEGANGERVALVKNDLYIPQDLLNTRAAQILEEYDLQAEAGICPTEYPDCQPTRIDHSNLTIGVSHSHSSPYYSSPSWGLALFQDVFDIRFFEYLAERMALSVIEAANNMEPVRMGAATVFFDGTQKHSFGPALADDGSPAGYPHTENDKTISVMRFDRLTEDGPEPLANFVTLGEHPEFLEGNNLITGEYIAPMERMADSETGATTVFVQNNTGSAEDDEDCRAHACSERAEFSHREYAQAERGARLMADAIKGAFDAIETGSRDAALAPLEVAPSDSNIVPFSSDFPVMVNDKQFAPPYSHPYPSVSNCRTHEAAAGNPGVPIVGLPDCDRITDGNLKTVTDQIPPPLNPGATVQMLKEAGVPIPDNYGAPSYAGLQETFQVHLQAIKVGDVLITVCPCEQWYDQSLNIKTRADKVTGNMYLGYDWGAQCEPAGDGKWSCPDPRTPADKFGAADRKTLTISDESYRRMRAQVNNDAANWDSGFESCTPQVANDGECPLRAESEPTKPDLIKGNYTQSEFTPPESGKGFPAELNAETGYDLVMPVGMANDYWGYIATYREYQRGDHYRKALSGLGAHSSDFLATRLVTMGGALNGGTDYPLNALDQAYMVDGAHQYSRAGLIGHIADAYVAAYEKAQPADGDVDDDDEAPGDVRQEAKDITRFDAVQFKWIGGGTFFDDPDVRVERKVGDGWEPFADMSGPLVVTADFPEAEELPEWRAGAYEWEWTATFEAFDSDIDTAREVDAECPEANDFGQWPMHCSQTPNGTYRFVVDGEYNPRVPSPGCAEPQPENLNVRVTCPYAVASKPFEVRPWEGITVSDPGYSDGNLSFQVGPRRTKTFRSRYPHARGGTSKDFTVGPIDYPDTWDTLPLPTVPPSGDKTFPRLERTYIDCVEVKGICGDSPSTGEDAELYCFSCTFRPWIDVGQVKTATVTIERADGSTETATATCDAQGACSAPVALYAGDTAYVARAGIVDTFGEINGVPSAKAQGTGERPTPAETTPAAGETTPAAGETTPAGGQTTPAGGGTPPQGGGGTPPGQDPSPGGGESPTARPTDPPPPPPRRESRTEFTERTSESGQYSDHVVLEARVTADGVPVVGSSVVFEMRMPDGVRTEEATTDEQGLASQRVRLLHAPGPYVVTARFEGNATFTGSADLTDLFVEREDRHLRLEVRRRYLAARLADRDHRLETAVGYPVKFRVDGKRLRSDRTNARGVAKVWLPRRYRSGRHVFRAVAPGDEFYRRAWDRVR
jgi:hypothetical protein